jgi:hypothetical protein
MLPTAVDRVLHAAFCCGGVELIHYAALRLALRIGQGVPMRLARTLDEARDLVLVRRVGGGYKFPAPSPVGALRGGDRAGRGDDRVI